MERVLMMATPVPQDIANEVMDRTGGMRLNNAMKEQVVNKAIAHAFEKREALIFKEENALARAFFIHAFGARAIQLLKKLGEPFVYENNDGHSKCECGTGTNWYIDGQHIVVRLKDIPILRRFGERTHNDHGKKNQFSITKEKNAALVERCRTWQDDVAKLASERGRVMTTLNAMLQGISTYKSLEKNWPEGKPFYKHLPKEFPFRHQVPANLVSDLNKALGI